MESNTKARLGLKIIRYEIVTGDNKRDITIKTFYKQWFKSKQRLEHLRDVRIVETGKVWGSWTRLFFPQYFITLKFLSEFAEKTTEANFELKPHLLKNELSLTFQKEKDMKIALERLKHLLKLG